MLSSSILSHTLLFIIISLILHHVNTQQQSNSLPPSESHILFTIMDSMSSDHQWRLSYPNPCAPGSSWPGLECRFGPDRFLHVSRLDFGSPPNPSCKSFASFPLLIFSLPHLQSVFFFNCFTHLRTTIVFPLNKLSFNSSLLQLSLRSNPSLVGSIPPRLSSLKSLKILTLSQNRLTGNIPPAIFTLENLVHLDLSYNGLTGSIPMQLGNVKNLEGLDLSYNSLVGPIPSTISELGLLQKLDLSSNSLFGAIPDGVEKLHSLSFMALSNNKLRGPFPKGISKLQNLQYFIIEVRVPLRRGIDGQDGDTGGSVELGGDKGEEVSGEKLGLGFQVYPETEAESRPYLGLKEKRAGPRMWSGLEEKRAAE